MENIVFVVAAGTTTVVFLYKCWSLWCSLRASSHRLCMNLHLEDNYFESEKTGPQELPSAVTQEMHTIELRRGRNPWNLYKLEDAFWEP